MPFTKTTVGVRPHPNHPKAANLTRNALCEGAESLGTTDPWLLGGGEQPLGGPAPLTIISARRPSLSKGPRSLCDACRGTTSRRRDPARLQPNVAKKKHFTAESKNASRAELAFVGLQHKKPTKGRPPAQKRRKRFAPQGSRDPDVLAAPVPA